MENPLEKSLGFQLSIAARSMKRALEVKLAEHDITSSQYIVLEILWKYNGISLGDLGKALNFDNPTITGIINRMARSKLIRRSRDRHDRRVVKVFLTPKSRELQSILPKLADAVNNAATDDFNKSEKKAVIDMAIRIRSNVNNNS